MLTKQQVMAALYAWIRQRPGLEFGNYFRREFGCGIASRWFD